MQCRQAGATPKDGYRQANPKVSAAALLFFADCRPYSLLGGLTPRMAYEGTPMPPLVVAWQWI